MIKSKVSTTVKTNPKFEAFLKNTQQSQAFVTIGVHADAGKYDKGPEVAQVAIWNEFGATLKHGRIPERSFFRSVINENAEKFNQWRGEMIDNILLKGMSVEQALEIIGFRIQQLIQKKIRSNLPPPNALSTQRAKARKGVIPQKYKGKKVGVDVGLLKSKTLIDSGLLMRSIAYKVSVYGRKT